MSRIPQFFYTVRSWLSPLFAALFSPSIPWSYRWRLLVLQPLNLLSYSIKCLPWALWYGGYRVIHIPTRSKHVLRAIVFEPPSSEDATLRPLHLTFHAGAFIGGIAEMDSYFCAELSRRSGAVVVSAEYRLAPANTFPAAHEDAEDVIKWLLTTSRASLNCDPETLTVSGFSAGGNLMMMAGEKARAAVGFYTPVDMRLPPWEKPKSGNIPAQDPMEMFLPLFDAYAGPVRNTAVEDARLHPVLRPIEALPDNILLIVPETDVLVHEQVAFVDTLNHQLEKEGITGREFKAEVFKDVFHGWLELPSGVLDESHRKRAFDLAIHFLIRHSKSLAKSSLSSPLSA